MPKAAKVAPADANNLIYVRVRDQSGEDTMFKVKRNGTKMKKIFNTYAARRGLEMSSSEYFSLHIFNAILRYDIISFADYLCHFFCSRAHLSRSPAFCLGIGVGGLRSVAGGR